jgi:glycosyltransferase involved in cell wall biosynthesis
MSGSTTSIKRAGSAQISVGIIAWNEERNIQRTLDSLFRQSLFKVLSGRELRCEILCLANGCTDRTRELAAAAFRTQSETHPFRHAFTCHTLDIRERGKNNSWNLFVHQFSAPEARQLILMDADILIDHPGTLANMVATLEENPAACVATDRPDKHIAAKGSKSLMERFSLLASQVTVAGEGQLCGQLYCIRSEVARRIYLPKDLAACEDGFIKAIVCTNFLTAETTPGRILQARDASHTFEAYTSIKAILKNQKRQMIGQAIVHILVDDYLRTLSLSERLDLARTLREKDTSDPFWLKRLIGEHLRRTRFFWRLIPGLAGLRFKRLARLRGRKRIICLPAAVAGFFVSMVSCFRARVFLERGQTQYWPHAKASGANP